MIKFKMFTRLGQVVPLCIFLLLGCGQQTTKKEMEEPISILEHVTKQYDSLYAKALPFLETDKPMPKSITDGKLRLVGIYEWTSGFYPSSLWYLYGMTEDEKWKERAITYTEKLDTIQYWEGNHDLGFMIGCSYGNGLKYMDSKPYEAVIVRAAQSLATRFKPKAGILQSWERNDRWECPVIVDNMMNLELLFNATKISGDSTYYDIAVTHADTTMKNHFREDNSSIHVLDYDTETGEVLHRNTAQGYSDGSAWARGQSWGLYGYTVMYRETMDPKYLDHAQKIAKFIKDHPNLPKDKVPYWDYDVPIEADTKRDASAAAIVASALYELSTFVSTEDAIEYRGVADQILETLSSGTYLAEIGSNEGLLLKHSVGSIPHNSEIDVPLNYADYYFLEALMRKERR